MDKGINSSSCDRMIIAKKLRYGGFMCQRHLLHCLSFRIIQIFSSILRRTNNETQVEKKPMILTSYSPSWLLNETVGTNSLKMYVRKLVEGLRMRPLFFSRCSHYISWLELMTNFSRNIPTAIIF